AGGGHGGQFPAGRSAGGHFYGSGADQNTGRYHGPKRGEDRSGFRRQRALFFARADSVGARYGGASSRAALETFGAVRFSARCIAGISDAAAGRTRTHRATRTIALDGKRLEDSRGGSGARRGECGRARGRRARGKTAARKIGSNVQQKVKPSRF